MNFFRKCKLHLLFLSVCLILNIPVFLSAQSNDNGKVVTWIRGSNLATHGADGGLVKTSGGNAAWNAGAISLPSQRIIRDGSLSFRVASGSALVIGLNLIDSHEGYGDVDYSIRFKNTSNANVNHGTAEGISLGSYSDTTWFTIRRIGSSIQFLKEDDVLYTSNTPSHGLLMADCSILHSNTTPTRLLEARIDIGDEDEDGLPDNWERQYIGSNASPTQLVAFTPEGDLDGDGVSNFKEFQDGTNASDDLSYTKPAGWIPLYPQIIIGEDGAISTEGSLPIDPFNPFPRHAEVPDQITTNGIFTFKVDSVVATTLRLNAGNSSRYVLIPNNDGSNKFFIAYGGESFDMGQYNKETLVSLVRKDGYISFVKDGVTFDTTFIGGGILHPTFETSTSGTTYKPRLYMSRVYTGDLDEDLMPDEWELLFLAPFAGLIDLQSFLPSTDSDGDGKTNYEEYIDGTHPLRKNILPASPETLAVSWTRSSATNLQLVGVNGGIKKVAGAAAWTNADAVGTRTMFQNGRINFRAKYGSYLAVGLTVSNDNRNYTDLEYCIRVNTDGKAEVFEGSSKKADLGVYEDNTRFSIRRVGANVEYIKDGAVGYVSQVPVTTALWVDSSFRNVGSEVLEAYLYSGDVDGDEIPDDWEVDQLTRLDPDYDPSYTSILNDLTPGGDLDGDGHTNREEYYAATDPLQQLNTRSPVQWVNRINTTNYSSGGLRKTSGAAGYNADASSSVALNGDSAFTFSVTDTGNMAVGLTDTNNNRAIADLEFAFSFSGGEAEVIRPELTARLNVGTYTSTTIFGIRRLGTKVEYLKDGLVVYTSVRESLPVLYADCSISTLNNGITSAYFQHLDADVDSDGLPDVWELQYLPPYATLTQLQAFQPGSQAPDGGGLTILEEYLNGTSPLLQDTDGDGMSDYWEIQYQFSPTVPNNPLADTDNDGLTDYDEFYVHGTNPRSADSDGDGFPDGVEVSSGLNPAEASDAFADMDGDGVPNLWEYQRGSDMTNSADVPAWDAIVNANFESDNPAQKEYKTLATAYASLPTTPGYRATVLIAQGEYLLEQNTSTARKVAYVGVRGVSSRYGHESVVLKEFSLTINEDTCFDSIVFDGGTGINVDSTVIPNPPKVRFQNCLFRYIQPTYNTSVAGNRGSALTNNGGHVTLAHCTIYRCTGFDSIVPRPYAALPALTNTGGTLRIINSVVWDDTAPNAPALRSGMPNLEGIDVQTSLIQGGPLGSLNVDPCLTEHGSLSINSTACLASGTPGVALKDLRGNQRSYINAPDLGAEQWVNTDGDSIPDWWEYGWFNTSELQDSHPLWPGAGVTLLERFLSLHSIPDLTDSDQDSLPDAWEMYYWNNLSTITNRESPAQSGGTVWQAFKSAQAPGIRDFDNDGMDDDWELAHGLNPADPLDAWDDPDGDFLFNREEYQHGKSPIDSLSPTSEGLTLTAPNPLTQTDTVRAVRNDYEAVHMAPLQWVYDLVRDNGPETRRQYDDDWDQDGISNLAEMTATPPTNPRLPARVDTDGDGLTSAWEVKWNFNPTNSDENNNSTSDGNDDSDNDGLSNYFEMLIGTNPHVVDSDMDGVSDIDEIQQGADPTRSSTLADTDDTDGDGWSNAVEIMAGTDPTAAFHQPTQPRLEYQYSTPHDTWYAEVSSYLPYLFPWIETIEHSWTLTGKPGIPSKNKYKTRNFGFVEPPLPAPPNLQRYPSPGSLIWNDFSSQLEFSEGGAHVASCFNQHGDAVIDEANYRKSLSKRWDMYATRVRLVSKYPYNRHVRFNLLETSRASSVDDVNSVQTVLAKRMVSFELLPNQLASAPQIFQTTASINQSVNNMLERVNVEINSMDRLVAGSIPQSFIDSQGGNSKFGLVFRRPAPGQANGNAEIYSYPQLANAYVYDNPLSGSVTQEDAFLSNTEIEAWKDGPNSNSPQLTQDVVFYRQGGKLHFRALFNEAGPIEIGVIVNGSEIGAIKWKLTSDEDIGSLLETIDGILNDAEVISVLAAQYGASEEDVQMLQEAATQSSDGGFIGFFRRNLTIKVNIPTWEAVKTHFVDGVRSATQEASRSVQMAAFGGKGFCEGAWYGVKDDAQSLEDLGNMLLNPAETAKTFYEGFKVLIALDVEGWKNVGKSLVSKFLDTGVEGVGDWTEPSAPNVASYLVGFTAGFITEQIAVTYVTAGLLKAGNVGAKIGEFIRKAAGLIPGALELADVALNARRVLAMKVKNSLFRRYSQDVLSIDEVKAAKEFFQDLESLCQLAPQ